MRARRHCPAASFPACAYRIAHVCPSTSTTTPPRRSIPPSSRRCCRTCASTSAIPRAPTPTASRAHDAVEQARGQVAALLGAEPDEIVFTGGGTEASNHAIKGAVFAKLRGLLRPAVRRVCRAAHRHQRRRASRDAAAVRVPEAARLQGHHRAGGSARPGRSRRGASKRCAAAARRRQHHARQQRGRHAAADPRDRRARASSAGC